MQDGTDYRSAKELARHIEGVGETHGIDVTAIASKAGGVWTTPEWTDWPDEMVTEIESVGRMHAGPHGDYWTPRG